MRLGGSLWRWKRIVMRFVLPSNETLASPLWTFFMKWGESMNESFGISTCASRAHWSGSCVRPLCSTSHTYLPRREEDMRGEKVGLCARQEERGNAYAYRWPAAPLMRWMTIALACGCGYSPPCRKHPRFAARSLMYTSATRARALLSSSG